MKKEDLSGNGQWAWGSGTGLTTKTKTKTNVNVSSITPKKEMFQEAPRLGGGLGMRMLQKMGWSQGEGLGKAWDGEVDPIKVSVKLDRKGLVSEWDAVSLAVEEVQHTEAEAGEDLAINMTIHNKLYNSDLCVLARHGINRLGQFELQQRGEREEALEAFAAIVERFLLRAPRRHRQV